MSGWSTSLFSDVFLAGSPSRTVPLPKSGRTSKALVAGVCAFIRQTDLHSAEHRSDLIRR